MDNLNLVQNDSFIVWRGAEDLCQEKWNKFLDLVGDDDFKIWVYGTPILSLLTYWIGGGLFTYMNFTNKPKWLRKYKVQEGNTDQLDWTAFMNVLKLVLFNQFVVSTPVMFVFWESMKARGLQPLREFPSFSSIAVDMFVFLCLREITFYYCHRLLHYKGLYKLIHKRHHEWTTPIAIMAVYCNPIEHVLSNLLPVIVGPIAMRSHVFTVWIWIFHITAHTIGDHSGYHLPFMPSPEFHDFHHAKFNNNFGVNGFLDWLHGTDASFRKTGVSKRHTFLFGLKSAREIFPDEVSKKKKK